MITLFSIPTLILKDITGFDKNIKIKGFTSFIIGQFFNLFGIFFCKSIIWKFQLFYRKVCFFMAVCVLPFFIVFLMTCNFFF